MPTASRLRPADPADLPALVLLEAVCFSTDRISARSFRRWLNDDKALLLVMDTPGVPSSLQAYALVLWHGHGRVARLYSLAVDPALRGHGLGRQLIDACVEAAVARGCQELRLEVSEANQPALVLYRQSGFEPFARHPAYYADGTDALRLRRRL